MAWTAPVTWSDVVSDASDFNEQIRDNLLALKQPPTSQYEANQVSNYTTNSTSGTYAYVDNTNFSLSITTTGGDVMVGFIGSGNALSTRGGVIDIEVDGTRLLDPEIAGINQIPISTSAAVLSFFRIIRGLSAGLHTFKLVWSVVSGSGAQSIQIWAGAGTANYDLHPRFFVREIS